MDLIAKFRNGLKKTAAKLAKDIQRIVSRAPRLDDAALEELESALIASDIGPATATAIVARVKEAGATDIFSVARAEIERLLTQRDAPRPLINRAPHPPTVIMLVGVNGTGKTTSAAKLAHHLKAQGQTVMLAACDTFRAAAIEQLEIWAQRVGCDIVTGQYGADSAAVAYDALEAAIKRKVDYLIIDTAGRLHTKGNLMEEMKKMRRVLQKRLPDAPHEVLLVLDGTTGTNALHQAREFHHALGVTGLIVTKLDGTAKGGIVVAIARELKIPVKFIGLGEQVDDLQPFDPKQFAAALFGG
ncbi:MAG: signal recognition particle-docking protein FtsY [Verrucomicrobiae bacterium]|nr:signal recognition particle-docking protein FtsY [Verrucomicrobiae bacterium]